MQRCWGEVGVFVTCHAAMLCYAISKVHTGVQGKGGPVFLEEFLPMAVSSGSVNFAYPHNKS